MAKHAPAIIFLALYLATAGCTVAGAALIWGLAVALFATAPFLFGLCVLVALGIMRNG